MKLSILYFSTLRDVTGCENETLETASGITVADLLALLYTRYPQLAKWDESILIAIDLEYADRDQLVQEGQEIAFMPPVQGG